MSRALRYLLVVFAIVAFASATTGADLVDLLTCGGEESADCGSESDCDHCPSCFAAHGHMTSLAAAGFDSETIPGSNAFAVSVRAFTPRVAVQDIFHPPIAASV